MMSTLNTAKCLMLEYNLNNMKLTKDIIEHLNDLNELELIYSNRLRANEHNPKTVREAIHAEEKLREIRSEKIILKNRLTH